MNKFLVFITFCACTYCVQAQNDLKYKSITGLSILYSTNRQADVQVATTQGVLFKNGWFTGLGVGIDEFSIRTVPLFANVSKFFGGDKYFASASIGTNYIWLEDFNKWWRGTSNTEKKAKPFYELSMGYKIGFGKKGDGFILGAGYSYKHIRYINEVTTWCNNPPCRTTKERYDFKLNRISIRIGLVL